MRLIGDGINDAPERKKGNVGIDMGNVGSDIAVDAADNVLVDNEIKACFHLLELSKKMMKTIKLNPGYFGRTRPGCRMRELLLLL